MASVELETIPGEKKMEENTEQQQQEQPPPVIPVTASNVEGKENPGFDHEEQLESELTLPPMTFVDFLPLLIEEAVSNDDIPKYAEFSTVIEQANQWIQDNPSYKVMKCESYAKRLQTGDKLDVDAVLFHESSFGINKYVRGLRNTVRVKNSLDPDQDQHFVIKLAAKMISRWHVRLWLAPRTVSDDPLQVLGYMTTLPDPSDSADDMSFFGRSTSPSFCTIPETMERLNKFLKKKPIPGTILNMETLSIKYEDTDPVCALNTEKMAWLESGKTDRTYVSAFRVYYVIGKPAFEIIGFHDEVPVCQNNFETIVRPRFCPFTTVVQRARKWLKTQKGIRVINMQTVPTFTDRKRSGECQIHSEKSTYTEQSGHDLQLARVLRIYYIHDPKSEVCPYGNIQLSTRLFIPTRMDDYYGKTCETFSKTMQRVITWLNLTQTPIFGVETVNYPFSPESYGTGVHEDVAAVSRIANSGKYYITTVRLYFPCEFKEPPPIPGAEEEGSWWACTVS